MHSGTYQRLAEKSMEQSQCKHRLKVGAKSEGSISVGQKTTGNLPHGSEPDWRSMTVLLRPSHIGCRDRGLVVFRHALFRFGVRVDHYLRVSTGKAAGKRKRAKNGNSKNLIHSQACNLFANQPFSSS